MPNDDLGQFPMPNKPVSDNVPTSSADVPTQQTNFPSQSSTPVEAPASAPTPTFEETPEEIPSVLNQTPSQENISTFSEEPPVPPVVSEPAQIVSPFVPTEEPKPEPLQPAPPPATPQPIPATLPQRSAFSMGPVIFAVIFIVAVISLAGAAFLFQQTQSLKGQLSEITKTLEKQETSPETTPTPSVVEIPEASPTPTTPVSTISAIPTATPTPILNPGSPMKPLSIASKVMQIAINHQPNAQLILIKTENANDSVKATTKYFFREGLTTKKYFYVLISGNNEPEVVDKQIYVTPDDNIPSLNDLVLQDGLGIDLDQAINIVNTACPDIEACTTAQAKAQYIKTSAGVIWHITLTLQGKTEPSVMQINALTKEIIFKTTDFSN